MMKDVNQTFEPCFDINNSYQSYKRFFLYETDYISLDKGKV